MRKKDRATFGMWYAGGSFVLGPAAKIVNMDNAGLAAAALGGSLDAADTYFGEVYLSEL